MLSELYTNSGTWKTVLASSAVGGVISWNWVPYTSKKQRAVSLLSGCAMAQFISEPIVVIFSNGHFIGAVAALIGLFGMSVVGMMFKWINTLEVKDIMDIFKDIINRLIDKIPS